MEASNTSPAGVQGPTDEQPDVAAAAPPAPETQVQAPPPVAETPEQPASPAIEEPTPAEPPAPVEPTPAPVEAPPAPPTPAPAPEPEPEPPAPEAPPAPTPDPAAAVEPPPEVDTTVSGHTAPAGAVQPDAETGIPRQHGEVTPGLGVSPSAFPDAGTAPPVQGVSEPEQVEVERADVGTPVNEESPSGSVTTTEESQ